MVCHRMHCLRYRATLLVVRLITDVFRMLYSQGVKLEEFGIRAA